MPLPIRLTSTSAFALLTLSFETPLNKSKLIFNLRGEDLMNLMNLFILSVGKTECFEVVTNNMQKNINSH